VSGVVPQQVELALVGVGVVVRDLAFEEKNVPIALAYARMITAPADGLRFFDDGDYTVRLAVASGHLELAYRIGPV